MRGPADGRGQEGEPPTPPADEPTAVLPSGAGPDAPTVARTAYDPAGGTVPAEDSPTVARPADSVADSPTVTQGGDPLADGRTVAGGPDEVRVPAGSGAPETRSRRRIPRPHVRRPEPPRGDAPPAGGARPFLATVPSRPDTTPQPYDNDVGSVLRVVPFRRLWSALTLSSLGDWLGLLATTALATELQKSYSGKLYALSGVLIVRLLPALLLGPVAGAVADRFDRRMTMVLSDGLRFVLFLSIPLVGTLPWLLVASFLVESVSLFWNPAKDAAVPNLLRREQLESANTLSLIATYGTAPIAAGLFALLSSLNRALASGVSWFHTNPVDLALYFNAVTFAVAGLTVWSLRGIGRADRAGAEPESFWRSIVDGWQFVRGTPLVRGLVIGILGGFSGAGAVIALGRPYVSLLDGGDAAYGVLFGAVFLGLAGGMALGPRVLGGYSRTRLFGLAVTSAGVILVAVAVLPNLVIATALVLVVGALAGIAWVTGYTLLQAEVSDDKRGRTFSLVQSLVRADLLLVLAAAPALAGLIGRHGIDLWNGARIRADGVTIVMLCGGLVAALVGLYAFRLMDDHAGVAVLPELWAAIRGRSAPPGAPVRPGLFVALEGGEGAGKSTQVALLGDWLRAAGREVVLTREPGGTGLGAEVRRILLGPGEVAPRAEALLYAADRAQHVETVIRPALERDAVVLSDRYVDSSVAYQGAGRMLDPDEIGQMSRWATGGLLPDLTILLDLPPQEGLRRVQARGAGDPAAMDRIEAEEVEFHQRVREGFLRQAAADRSRYVTVDATLPPAVVAQRIEQALQAVLPAAVDAPVPVARAEEERPSVAAGGPDGGAR